MSIKYIKSLTIGCKNSSNIIVFCQFYSVGKVVDVCTLFDEGSSGERWINLSLSCHTYWACEAMDSRVFYKFIELLRPDFMQVIV